MKKNEGIFQGIGTFDNWKACATIGFFRLIDNRVGVGS